MEFLKFKYDSRVSRPVIYVIFIRIFVKILLVLSALYFKVSYSTLIIVIAIFLVSEIYRNIGTILSALDKIPANAVGGIVSAIDGAIIILLLYYTNLLGTDLYLFVLLSIAFDTIEYGMIASFSEGATAGLVYAFFSIFSSMNFGFLLVKVFFIFFLGLISGWLSDNLKTTQNLLKNTLERTRKEERMEKVKNDFIGVATNQFRGPISVVNGYIDLLLNERVGSINNEQQKYILSIQENTEKLKLLIEDLFNIVSIQDSKLQLNPTENSIHDFLDNVNQDFLGISKLRGISVVTDFRVGKEYTLFDYDKLKIAISNILDSSVSAAKSQVSFSSYLEKGNWVVEIRDNGVGISKNEIKQIFDPDEDIFKIVRTLEARGFGIYIAKLIVDAHKGNLNLISIEGIGSTFKITLPL